MWYRYKVSEVHMDMLRYDGGWIGEIPPVDEFLSDRELECIVYQKVPDTIWSRYRPTIARWNAFGIEVSDVEKVPMPKGVKLWTCRHADGPSRDLVWRQEQF